MKTFIGENLDYSRIASNQNPLYNYTRERIGRFKFQPYSKEDFAKILRKYKQIYKKRNNPHLETILLLDLFILSKLAPTKFAKNLNIHGGSVKDLLKIVYEKKFFTEFSVLDKIENFIENQIPNQNKETARKALKNYKKYWKQKSNQGKFEERCREIFKGLFGVDFKKTYPKWLKSERGGQMHLDGYNKYLKIAFEYQGEQHYRFIPYYHRTKEVFEKRQVDDRWKKNICKENRVVLIEIPYTVKFQELKDYIIEKCREIGIIIDKDSVKMALKHISKSKYKVKINNEKNKISKKGLSYKLTPHPFALNNEQYDFEDFENEFLWLSGKIRDDINANVEQIRRG